MHIAASRGFLTAAATLLVALGQGGGAAVAAKSQGSNARTWLDRAVLEKHCPSSPVNVPAGLRQAGSDALRQQISVVEDTLQIAGTPNPDHIVIKATGVPGMVRVVFNGKRLGSFGPVARIHVQAGDGDDVVIVEPNVDLPTRLEGGAGNDCLQGGSGADLLFGGDGDDVLIAGTGRPALDAGGGSNRIVFPPSMGELRIAPSADGDLLPLIARGYTLKPLRQNRTAHDDALPSPIVLGPADLTDARTIALIKDAYAAGQAVALLNATAADYAQLRALLGHPNAAEGPTGSETADLFFMRKALRPGTLAFDYDTGIFQRDPTPASRAAGRDLDQRRLELLSRVFSAAANVRDDCSTTNDLTCLADGYFSTSTTSSQQTGSSLTLSDTVYNVRSFSNKADFYYVSQIAEYIWGANQPGLFSQNNASTGLIGLSPAAAPPSLIQSSPATTQCTVSTTSGVNWSIGGSAGWNATEGLNAALTGGVTVDNSQTITCPQIAIENQSEVGQAQWTYAIPQPDLTPSNTQFVNQWVWEVPYSPPSSYNPNQLGVTIVSAQNSGWLSPFEKIPPLGNVIASFVPLPFGDTFALQNPNVLSVNPTCVNAGNKFTINGSGFYPSLVTSVLLGGTAVDMSAISPESDKAISVVAPETSAEADTVVVQTAEGLSNSNVTIEISIINLCNAQSRNAAGRSRD